MLRGGHVTKEGGLWYEPTLIEPRSNEAEIVQHEVFGPVLTLQTFADEDEAVALANGTRYGLAGIVYTQRRRAGRAHRPAGARGHGVGQLLPRPRPERALRRAAESAASAGRAATTPSTSTAT